MCWVYPTVKEAKRPWTRSISGQFVLLLISSIGAGSVEVKGERGNGGLLQSSSVEESSHTWLKDGCPVSSWLSSQDSCRFQSSAPSSI